jgi:catechol 2,3-dioxygenase-like lactoylglutathione lyase family enzyme
MALVSSCRSGCWLSSIRVGGQRGRLADHVRFELSAEHAAKGLAVSVCGRMSRTTTRLASSLGGAARGDGASRPANTQGLYRMALAVDDVRAAAGALAADGRCGKVPETVTIPMPDTPTGGFTVLFLADPDGAVVELAERPRSQVRRPSAPA